MERALVVGGTGFVGRHAVAALHEHGYAVTSLSRGSHGYRFPSVAPVRQLTGDRTDPETIHGVAADVDPDVVVDCAAYHPQDVKTAVDAFADVDAYVYVSSGATYSEQVIPKREGETPLHDCRPDQARDDSMATYGPRKAECDRLARTAADDGVNATSVRPTVVYGPQTIQADAFDDATPDETQADSTDALDGGGDGGDGDGGDEAWRRSVPATWTGDDVPTLQTHHDYWIDRVAGQDRVLVPGDGTAIWHRAYVEDVAAALRIVAERGTPGTAYNVADRRVATLGDVVDLIAGALDTSIEQVHASRRELQTVGLDPNDFMLYHHPQTSYPHVLATARLAALGWESTPLDVAMARTVAESRASGRTGSEHDPGPAARRELLESLSES